MFTYAIEGVMDRRKILLVLAAVIAALGTMLVWLYVRGADNRAQAQYETVNVIVATQDIAPGETFAAASQAGKFEKKAIPANTVLAGAQDDLQSLDGEVALTTIYSGEQVVSAKWGGSTDVDVTSKVIAIPKGKMAVTVNLTDPQRIAGFAKPGSAVTVFVAVAKDKSDADYARTLLEKVTVLGVGDTSTITKTKTTKEGDSTTEPVPQTLVTLAVTQQEAERLAWGTTFGTLSLGLVNDATKLDGTPRITDKNLVG
jgi:pilus assembly protein CpaB